MANGMDTVDVAGVDAIDDRAGGTDFIGGYGVPMDPMDLLQCDSCQ